VEHHLIHDFYICSLGEHLPAHNALLFNSCYSLATSKLNDLGLQYPSNSWMPSHIPPSVLYQNSYLF
jgi:hypothetical protein